MKLVVDNKSPSQAFNQPDADLSQSRYVTPGFKLFSYQLLLKYLVEKVFWKIDSIIMQNFCDIFYFFCLQHSCLLT